MSLQHELDKQALLDNDIAFCTCDICSEIGFCKVECIPFKRYVKNTRYDIRRLIFIKKYNDEKLHKIAFDVIIQNNKNLELAKTA